MKRLFLFLAMSCILTQPLLPAISFAQETLEEEEIILDCETDLFDDFFPVAWFTSAPEPTDEAPEAVPAPPLLSSSPSRPESRTSSSPAPTDSQPSQHKDKKSGWPHPLRYSFIKSGKKFNN